MPLARTRAFRGGYGGSIAVPATLTWTDSEDLGILLHERFPDLDPLTIRFTDLRTWVCELEQFDDNPRASNEAKL